MSFTREGRGSDRRWLGKRLLVFQATDVKGDCPLGRAARGNVFSHIHQAAGPTWPSRVLVTGSTLISSHCCYAIELFTRWRWT